MKHPPIQYTDYEAHQMLEDFIVKQGAPADEGTYASAAQSVKAQSHPTAK